jgi:hypothetical protein
VFGTTPQLVSGGAITQSGTTMQFTIAQAVWMLPDPTNAAAVFLSPTDQQVLTPAAGPGTGSRVDSFVVKQNNYENADADSRVNITNLAGTAGAPGLPQTLPSSAYFRYANITVPAGAATAAACTVTVLSPTTFAPVWIKSPTYALLSTVTGAPGQHATVTADPTASYNTDYVWSGASWIPFLLEGKLTLTGTPAVASGAATAVSWAGLTQLTAGASGLWSSGSPTRLALPFPGLWQINWRLTTGGAASAVVRSNLNLNGSAIADSQLNVAGTAGLTDPFINGTYDLVVNNSTSYVELLVNANAGGVVLAGTQCWITAKLVS